MKVTHRPATPQDAGDCAAILREWIAETNWFPSTHPASADLPFMARRIDQSTVILAVANGDCLGFVALEGDFLSCLYVRRAARGQGIGARLLSDVRALQTRGFALWTFQANLDAQRFYLREGLVEVQRTDGQGNEEGLPDIKFRWSGAI